MTQVEKLLVELKEKYKINPEQFLELYSQGLSTEEMAEALVGTLWAVRVLASTMNLRLPKKYRIGDLALFYSRFSESAELKISSELIEADENLGMLSKQVVQKEKTIRSLQAEVSKYRRALKQETATDDISLLIASLVERINTTEPTDLKFNLKSSSYSGYTQFVMLSDLHMEQTVTKGDVGDCNAYSWAIAEQRLGRVFSELLNAHRGEHFVIIGLLGDMLDGLIHDSLETSNKPLGQAVADLAVILANYIKSLSKVYQYVYVPCVSGNHERITDHKKSHNNGFGFGFLLYSMIKGLCSGYPNINIEISTSGFLSVEYGNTVLGFTHGDYIRGFGDTKILKTKEVFRQTTGKIPDSIFSGHTHKAATEHMSTGLWITNGSLIGVNAYSHTNGFMGLPASQTIGSLLDDGTIEHVRLVTFS